MDYRNIQKLIVGTCYALYVGWSFFKVLFKDEEGFIDVANKVDLVIAAAVGALLRFSYDLGQTLRAVSKVLPTELSERFDSMFNLVKANESNVQQLAADMRRMTTVNDPYVFPDVPTLVSPRTDVSDETIRMFDLDQTRAVEIRIPRNAMQ
jgi:hypothetical protein